MAHDQKLACNITDVNDLVLCPASGTTNLERRIQEHNEDPSNDLNVQKQSAKDLGVLKMKQLTSGSIGSQNAKDKESEFPEMVLDFNCLKILCFYIIIIIIIPHRTRPGTVLVACQILYCRQVQRFPVKPKSSQKTLQRSSHKFRRTLLCIQAKTASAI